MMLELGLRSAVGRTLEATGSVVAEVQVDEAVMTASAQGALADATVQGRSTPSPRPPRPGRLGARRRRTPADAWGDPARVVRPLPARGRQPLVDHGRASAPGRDARVRARQQRPAFPRVGGAGAVRTRISSPSGLPRVVCRVDREVPRRAQG
ncbi:hypothetical protein NKG05_10920 [Oerskovia sp. M15]